MIAERITVGFMLPVSGLNPHVMKMAVIEEPIVNPFAESTVVVKFDALKLPLRKVVCCRERKSLIHPK